VYRHFPLYNIHSNAQAAAYTAEAAGKQGKFFEMVDLLFAGQDEWSKKGNPEPYFLDLATKLKLDLAQYKEDVTSPEVKAKVTADAASGNEAGVSSTPSFYLDGQKLDTVKSFDEFMTLLEETGKK
jgi:protein-disulfide isomerase